MAAWKYVKGSEKDFAEFGEDINFIWVNTIGRKIGTVDDVFSHERLLAQRERVTSVNDDRLARDMTRHEITKRDTNPVDESTRYDHVDGMMLRSTHGEWVKTDMDTYQKIKPLVADNVNHPKHYTQGGIECIDAIKAATVGKSGIEAVCVANVVKYLWRYEEKNGVEDVKKARWYLERLISELESVK